MSSNSISTCWEISILECFNGNICCLLLTFVVFQVMSVCRLSGTSGLNMSAKLWSFLRMPTSKLLVQKLWSTINSIDVTSVSGSCISYHFAEVMYHAHLRVLMCSAYFCWLTVLSDTFEIYCFKHLFHKNCIRKESLLKEICESHYFTKDLFVLFFQLQPEADWFVGIVQHQWFRQKECMIVLLLFKFGTNLCSDRNSIWDDFLRPRVVKRRRRKKYSEVHC